MTRTGKSKPPSIGDSRTGLANSSSSSRVIPDPFDMTGGGCISYCKRAPAVLVKLHRRLQGGNKNLLERLLTDSRMEPAWREIELRLLKDQGIKQKFRKGPLEKPWKDQVYEKLWSEIACAFARSGVERQNSQDRVVEPRSKIRDRYLRIAEDARNLTKKIADGPFDLLAFEFFPDNIAQEVFKSRTWSQLPPDVRCELAHRSRGLALWPSMTDLLETLASCVEKSATEVFSKSRLVDRDTHDRCSNIFIRRLSRTFFQDYLDGPMSGTLGRITSVVFNRTYNKDSVRKALRHTHN